MPDLGMEAVIAKVTALSRTSHVTRNRGTRVARHPSLVTRHTSHVKSHTSFVTRHTSHVTNISTHPAVSGRFQRCSGVGEGERSGVECGAGVCLRDA